MIITYKSRFLTWGEVWFDNPAERNQVDCMIHLQRSTPIPATKTRLFHTYLVDLDRDVEQLKANLKGDTWRKIRRAREQDTICCEYLNPQDRKLMDEFEKFYNAFAAIKGINPLQRWRMDGLAAAGALDLSMARDANGEILVYHANYRDKNYASGINSASLFRNLADSVSRNMIGRANLYLTWSDLLRYKEQGLKSYDFGGWYTGDDPAMLSVNRFKASFGGRVLRRYQCEKIMTLKGWIVLRAAGLLKQRRTFLQRPDIHPIVKEPEIAPASAAL